MSDPAWNIDLKLSDPTTSSAPDFIDAGHFQCATAQIAGDAYQGNWGFMTYEQTWIPFAVLGSFTLVLLLLLCVVLKRRDPV